MSNFQPQLTPDNQQNPLNTQAKNTSDSFEPTKHSSKYIKKVDLAKIVGDRVILLWRSKKYKLLATDSVLSTFL